MKGRYDFLNQKQCIFSRHRPEYNKIDTTTMKFSLANSAALLALVASASAFAPVQQAAPSKTALKASDEVWDPMGLYTLGSGDAFDTFPNMFPNEQFLQEAETKHGRMAMLAWTGVWATHEVRLQMLLACRPCLFLANVMLINETCIFQLVIHCILGRTWTWSALPWIPSGT